MKEIWKKIEGQSHYEISSLGRVRSYRKANAILDKPNIKKQEVDIWGYKRVSLCSGSVCKHHKVHRLIATAFIPNPLSKKEINHINGVKIDNRIENLEWVTRSENAKHAYSSGLSKRMQGELNGHSILSVQDVSRIRELWSSNNYMQKDIAGFFGIARTTVSAIVNKYNWKHV